jgi:kynurenine 3-monooxygenase
VVPRVNLFKSTLLRTMTSPAKAVVVGAGPVGCLAAISFAKAGWDVLIYEGRPGAYW